VKTSDKSRVLAVTVLRHVESRSLIVKLHVLKTLGGSKLKVHDTRTLKSLSRIEMKTLDDGLTTATKELSFLYEGGRTFNWVCQAGLEMTQFVGCLTVLSRETLRSNLTVLGVDIAIVEQWSAQYKSKALSSSTREGIKGRTDEAVMLTSSALTKEEERDLQGYVDTYQIDVGDVRTLVARLHKEVFDLEGSNIHTLLERGKQADKIKASLDCLEFHPCCW